MIHAMLFGLKLRKQRGAFYKVVIWFRCQMIFNHVGIDQVSLLNFKISSNMTLERRAVWVPFPPLMFSVYIS